MGEFSFVSATGNMNLRVQVPALRFFSIKIVLGLQRHYPLEVLGRSLRGGLRPCFSCYAARRAQVGRLERKDNYFYYIIVLCYLFNIIDFFLVYDCVIHVSTTSIAWMVGHGG